MNWSWLKDFLWPEYCACGEQKIGGACPLEVELDSPEGSDPTTLFAGMGSVKALDELRAGRKGDGQI